MKINNKLKTGLLLGASTLALSACAGTSGTIEEAVTEFDAIQSGEVEFVYDVNSDVYGEYSINMTGQFELIEEETEQNEQANSGLIQKANATELEDEQVEPVEGQEIELEEIELTEEELEELQLISEEGELEEEGMPNEDELYEESPSRKYNYAIEEENRVFIDGQETTSVGEIIALDDTMYDKVFLTGSEADGRFVYDSRDVGIMEYPIADFLTISPIIDAFDLENSDIEVTKGDLHNDESGHVFTVTPEEVATALQGSNESGTTLGQNILGLVSEANVSEVIIGVNDNTFSVEAISTGEVEDSTPTSEAETNDEEEAGNTEEQVVGSLVITKTEGDVEITEPTNAMDIDEFSSLIELFYQQQAEGMLEENVSEDELLGEDAIENDEQFGEEELTEEELEELETEEGETEEVEQEEQPEEVTEDEQE